MKKFTIPLILLALGAVLGVFLGFKVIIPCTLWGTTICSNNLKLQIKFAFHPTIPPTNWHKGASEEEKAELGRKMQKLHSKIFAIAAIESAATNYYPSREAFITDEFINHYLFSREYTDKFFKLVNLNIRTENNFVNNISGLKEVSYVMGLIDSYLEDGSSDKELQSVLDDYTCAGLEAKMWANTILGDAEPKAYFQTWALPKIKEMQMSENKKELLLKETQALVEEGFLNLIEGYENNYVANACKARDGLVAQGKDPITGDRFLRAEYLRMDNIELEAKYLAADFSRYKNPKKEIERFIKWNTFTKDGEEYTAKLMPLIERRLKSGKADPLTKGEYTRWRLNKDRIEDLNIPSSRAFGLKRQLNEYVCTDLDARILAENVVIHKFFSADSLFNDPNPTEVGALAKQYIKDNKVVQVNPYQSYASLNCTFAPGREAGFLADGPLYDYNAYLEDLKKTGLQSPPFGNY